VEIKISARAFAEFVMGSPSKKSSTVRSILKPQSPEAQIPRGYYTRAIKIIRAYHDRDNDYKYVQSEIRNLQAEMMSDETSQARTKRNRNLIAVEAYMRAFADRRWRIVSCRRIHYSSNSVRISATPDLTIQDGERIRLIKLGVRKEKEIEETIRLMLRVVYQAAKTGMEITPRDITYFDVATGEAINGDHSDNRLAQTIERGCTILHQMIELKAA
jgi:hypothetical protein